MITYTLEKVVAEGSATVNQETGNTVQACTITTKISGLKIGDKLLTDGVDFEVPNSEIVGSEMPIVAAWLYIRDTLAPAWVAENYSAA